jgi:hypothetical protein
MSEPRDEVTLGKKRSLHFILKAQRISMLVGMFTLLPRDSYGFPTTRSSRALISVSHNIVKIPKTDDCNEG